MIRDPEPQTAAGKVLLHFLVDELDIHVAPVLLGDGIRLYDAPGGEPIHLQRDGDDPTLAVNLRFRPIPSPTPG